MSKVEPGNTIRTVSGLYYMVTHVFEDRVLVGCVGVAFRPAALQPAEVWQKYDYDFYAPVEAFIR